MSSGTGTDFEGRLIGRYRIESLIGAGGMGAVYRAVDPFLRRVVAVKVLAAPPDDQTAQERFFREARAIARLDHRNIVRIYEADAPGGVPYIAMEFLDGQDGREFVRSNPPLSRALDVMAQVFEGLACAHELGVIHRDVKPGNVILLPDDSVKLIDFGLARLADDQRDLTQGQVFGSAPYLAPEQITDPGKIDARADIYSAGVILFSLITGTLPFKGATVAETLGQIVRTAPAEILPLRPDCPPELAALVRSCMSKDRNDRPSSALEVAEALRQISRRISGARVNVPPPAPWLPDPSPGPDSDISPGPTLYGADDNVDSGPLSLVEDQLRDSGIPEAPSPFIPVKSHDTTSMRPFALVLVAGLVLSVATGAVIWSRRSGPAPARRGEELLPLPAFSAPTRPSGVGPTIGGPRLVVEEPASRKLRIHARTGEKISFRARVENPGPAPLELQWRLNDEIAAAGTTWVYTAGPGPRIDLVSVCIPGVEVTARTTASWYVNVE